MAVLILSFALASLGDVDQALVLYDAALYQSALDTLPGDCAELEHDAQRCFRVRGLCEVALNQRKMALQSWTKMCLLELAVSPPPLAPTSVALWNRACERAQWLSRFRLDEIATNNDRALIALKRPGGPGERLAGIRVWMKTPVDTAFEGIELTKAGTYWKAAEDTALIPGPFKYYIDFRLVAGDGYRSGSARYPLAGKAVEHFESHQFSALTNPWPDRSSPEKKSLCLIGAGGACRRCCRDRHGCGHRSSFGAECAMIRGLDKRFQLIFWLP